MTTRDAEALLDRLAELKAEGRELERQRSGLCDEIKAAEALAQQLQLKATECARAREMDGALRADQAKSFVKLLIESSGKRHPTSGIKRVPLSAVQRSERKLELTLQVEALEQSMRAVSREVAEWSERADKAAHQHRAASRRLQAVPARYTETIADVRARLVSVLSQRREVEAALTSLEASKGGRVDQLKAELRSLRRSVREATDDLFEVRREEGEWTQLVKAELIRCEPMKERVLRLKGDLESWGPNGLAHAAIEGLARDQEAIPVSLVVPAVRCYLAPESEASDEEIQAAAIDLGDELDVGALRVVAERLGIVL